MHRRCARSAPRTGDGESRPPPVAEQARLPDCHCGWTRGEHGQHRGDQCSTPRHHDQQRGDGGAEAQRAFERDVFPLVGDLAVADVKKAHVQNIVDTMMARDVVRMTKRVLSDLRQMFGFALDRDYVEADPTARIKKARRSIGFTQERMANAVGKNKNAYQKYEEGRA